MQRFKHILSALLMLPLLLLSSCQGDRYIESEPVIVVEGWIGEGEFPIIFVTTSLPMSYEKRPIEEIGDHILNWAFVTISDGERTEMLTGRVNGHYWLPYYFTSNSMRGEVGKTYKIEVRYEGYHAEATTSIPPTPTMDSLSIEAVAPADTSYAIFAHVPPQAENASGCYKVFVGIEGESYDYESSFLGLYSDFNIEQGGKLPVYRSYLRKKGEKFNPNFHSGERVHVRFTSINQEAYDYWVAFQKEVSLSSNPIFPVSENLPSNIRGGLGLWYGFSSSEKSVVIP